MADRPDGPARMDELVRLLEGQRAAGSQLADGLLQDADLGASFWLVEPIGQPAPVEAAACRRPRPAAGPATGPQRSRPRFDADTGDRGSYDGSIVGTRHPGLDVSSFPFSLIPVREVPT